MSLIVEDGSLVPGAESYASVIDTDAYFLVRKNPTAWSGLLEPAKEENLRMATEWMDLTYVNRWKGSKVSDDQSLDWPRHSVEDADGFSFGSDEIPQDLRRALFEAALRNATADLIPDDTDGGGKVTKLKQKLGPLEKETEWAPAKGSTSSSKRFPKINSLLRNLIEASSQLRRA